MPRAIHIGVGAVDGDVMLDGHRHGTLHGGAAHDFLETAEYQRVVRDDQVEAAVYRFGDNGLGGIGTQQCPGDVGIGISHLNARIVPLLLESQRSILGRPLHRCSR